MKSRPFLPFSPASALFCSLLLLISCGKKDEVQPSPAVTAKGDTGFTTKAPVAGVDASEARTALVIGVGNYHDIYFQNLDAPVEDARKSAEKLQTLGFEVTLKLNPNRNEMLTLTDRFGESLSRRKGVGLFYFSGHGCLKPDEADPNFLVPSGTNIGSREDLPQEAVNAQRVANRMKDANNRLNLVFLDACRSNTLPSRTKAAAGGLASMRGASGLMFFFATQPNEVALESNATRSSLFTDALLAHMAAPGLSFMDMMADVTASTEAASLKLTEGDNPFKQSPFMTGTLSGRFSFAPAGNPAAVPVKDEIDPFNLKWTQEDVDRMAKEPGSFWKNLQLKPKETPGGAGKDQESIWKELELKSSKSPDSAVQPRGPRGD